MRGVLSIERTHREPSGPHGTHRRGQRGASESREAEGAGGISIKPRFDPGRLGHRSESPQRGSQSPVHDPDAGVDAAVSRACCSASEAGSAADTQSAQEPLKTAVLALISFYRATLSPAIPSSCRFYPTCSAYAYDAVSQWGVRRGIGLAVRRVLRCRPFGSFGYDPVPPASRVRGGEFVARSA
jgi:uncharacterized protein